MKRLLFAVLATLPAFGAAPTISSIVVRGTNHEATNFTYLVSASVTCQLLYGLSPGVYTYQGGSGPSADAQDGSVHQCNISLTGLKPGTTYYILPTARLSADSTSDNCTVSACGAIEQPVPTDPEPAVHPVKPTYPTIWNPTEPDTTSYTKVPMQPNIVTHNCEAAANVPAPGGGHWASGVNTGDSLQTVVNKIWYDTAVQFTGGTWCYVIDNGDALHAGVQLPRYAIDGGATHWVVLETVPASAADFPPYGSRIGPAYEPKLAALRVYTPAMPENPAIPPSPFACCSAVYHGQLFDAHSTGAHNFWFRNMEWSVRNDTSVYPVGAIDPPAYGPLFESVGFCGSAPYPNWDGCSADPGSQYTPSYMVIDRILVPQMPWPVRQMGCWDVGGNFWKVVGTDCRIDMWQPAMWPQRDPIVTGPTTITIPYSIVQLNQFDNNPMGALTDAGYHGTSTDTLTINTGSMTVHTQCGLSWAAGNPIDIISTMPNGAIWRKTAAFAMTGTVTSYSCAGSVGTIVANITNQSGGAGSQFSNWTIEQPVVVTFSGVSTYTGEVWFYLDSTGLVVDISTPASGVSATCNRTAHCHVRTDPAPLNRSTVPLSQWFFYGQFNGSGTFNFVISTPDKVNPTMFQQWRPQGVFINAGDQGVLENNFMTAIGASIYNDTEGDTSNIGFFRNYWYFPRSKMQTNPSWDGYGYTYRNIFETKQMRYFAFEGNVWDGSAAFQNAGQALYLAGSYAGPFSTGVTDATIRNNLMKHMSSAFHCAGGGAARPPDALPSWKIEFENNIIIDLNRDIYNNTVIGGAGFLSGPITSYPTCSDMRFEHNTFGLTRGNGPALMEFGGNGSGGVYFGDGLVFKYNLAFTSYKQADGGVPTINGINGGTVFSSFPPSPGNPASSSSDTNFAGYLNGNFLRAGASVLPNWEMGYNLVVGAQMDPTGNGSGWADLTQTQVTNLIQTPWPDSTSKFGTGNTMALRMANIGLDPTMDLTSGNLLLYKPVSTPINSSYIGANPYDILAATGTVTGIKILPGATTLGFSYTAPDSRACNVDVSSNGTSWTRFTDSGGVRARTLVATGLTASTAYQYRLLCYFDQAALYEYLADQITSGTATTLSALNVDVAHSFTLSGTATKVVVTMAPMSGSAVTGTCTTSPCVLRVPNGTYNVTVQPQNSGSSNVGAPSTSRMTVYGTISSGLMFDSAPGSFDSATGLFDSH